ncbi:hypothetical protein HID58_046701 [Brassica napus]|uniref:Uncharacterized protein n=1 Tax=Brassica napus TaxID=3708 RepID=A0ABQ8AXB4_BRANA|nr:hypothetical protein HID58_046701 [Brassica napus]
MSDLDSVCERLNSVSERRSPRERDNADTERREERSYIYRTGERQGRKEKKEERMELICFAPSHASFFRSRLGDTCLHKPHINVS